jgi:hypothetical protein
MATTPIRSEEKASDEERVIVRDHVLSYEKDKKDPVDAKQATRDMRREFKPSAPR